MSINVYLDTNVFIRFLESEDDGLLSLVEDAAAGVVSLFTSEFTLAEALVEPLRASNTALITAYEDLLQGDDIFSVLPVDRSVLKASALVRATLGNKGPDAIHVATAQLSLSKVFVSSDRRIRLPDGIKQITIEQVRNKDLWP